MYTIFDTDIRHQQGQRIDATCLNAPPWAIHHAWRYATPLVPLQYPAILEFAIPVVPNPPDTYWNGAGFLVIHQRLAAIFTAFGTSHEAYPVLFRDTKTKHVLSDSKDYVIYRILDTAPLLDPHTLDEGKPGIPLRLNAALHGAVPPVCLDTTFRSLIVVHHDVRTAIESQGITGGRFLTVDEYNTLFRFPLTEGA